MIPDVSEVLPDGTKLHQGGFVVGKILGQGGFGITYHGADVKLRRYVAIKEFFPPGCVRNGDQVVPNNCANYSKAKARFL